MASARSQRLLAGLGIFAAAILITPPVSAVAAPPAVDLQLYKVLIPVDAPLRYGSISVVNPGDATTLSNVVITVESAGLAGIAAVEPDDNSGCTATGTTIQCKRSTLSVSGGTYGEIISFIRFKPLSRTVDKKGDLKVTLASDGNATLTKTTTVTLADGVNLSAGRSLDLKAAPGARVDLPLTVRNTGKIAVKGSIVQFDRPPYFSEDKKRFDNCLYSTMWIACRFDSALAPGKEYGLSESFPLQIRSDTVAPNNHQVRVRWDTLADAEYFLGLLDSLQPVRGTDGPLTLVESPSDARSLAQTDIDILDNMSLATINLTGSNRADQAAVGAAVTGTVGSTVRAKVGVRGGGPARVTISDGAVGSRLIVPAGTSVTEIPAGCSPGKDGKVDHDRRPATGAPEYICTKPGLSIEVGEAYTFDFGLRLDTIGESTGTVVATTSSFSGGPLDPNQDNDTATLSVRTTVATATGGIAGGGTVGGSLPITGANARLIGGAGIALVAFGAGVYLVARRRRTRFTT